MTARRRVQAVGPIRYPVEEEGRFVPSTTEEWLSTFNIDDGSVKPRSR